MSQSAKASPSWTERYNTTSVLIETFIETPRFTGALYKASGWAVVGTTNGRGRYDRHNNTKTVPSGLGWSPGGKTATITADGEIVNHEQ